MVPGIRQVDVVGPELEFDVFHDKPIVAEKYVFLVQKKEFLALEVKSTSAGFVSYKTHKFDSQNCEFTPFSG